MTGEHAAVVLPPLVNAAPPPRKVRLLQAPHLSRRKLVYQVCLLSPTINPCLGHAIVDSLWIPR